MKKPLIQEEAYRAGLNDSDMKPFLKPETTFAPVKQLYNGYEIEKRYLLMDGKGEDHSPKSNALITMDEVLRDGTTIRQGYIKDLLEARIMLEELGIELDTDMFSPNTVRLRQYGKAYILTLKNRKEVKKREVEWELTRQQFNKYWSLTKGARVEKKRLEKKIKGYTVEIDAFTDRLLLLAEIEVDDEAMMAKLPKLGMDITGQSVWTNKNLSK